MEESKKKELEYILGNLRPSEWDKIPDIDLYKDQLIEYLKRQHIGFAAGAEEPLTSAMINNYVKAGVIPRANGKRYGREHIAYLTAVSLLKQVLSVQETGKLLEISADKRGAVTRKESAGKKESGKRTVVTEACGSPDDIDARGFYEKYEKMLDESLTLAKSELEKAGTDEELKDLAMKLAVRSYADKLLARELIACIDGE